MTILANPPRRSFGDGDPGDLDGLLRRYFRAEMPNPWPPLKMPPTPKTATPPRPTRWTFRLQSHLALAAAVVCCLAGYFYLQSSFPAVTAQQTKGAKTIGSVPLRPPTEDLPSQVEKMGNRKSLAVSRGQKTSGPGRQITKIEAIEVK